MNRRARVLLVITHLDSGGAQETVFHLAEGLSARGFEVAVAAAPGGPGETRLRDAGVSFRSIDSFRRAVSPRHDLKALRELVAAVRETRPDVVHTHSSKSGVLGRFAAALDGRCVVIHTSHGLPVSPDMGRVTRAALLAAERLAARFSDKIIAVSQATSDELVALKAAKRNQIAVLPSGVDVAGLRGGPGRVEARRSLGLSDDAPVAGWVGRHFAQKRPDLVVKVALSITEKVPRAEVLLVGDGPDLETTRKAVAGRARVRVLGFRSDIETIYAAMDVMFLVSAWEGLPRTILEAMSLGIPVVSTDVSGVSEVVIDGESGFLAREGDHRTVAERVELLLGDEGARERMGARARQIVNESYSSDHMIEATAQLYESMLSQERFHSSVRPSPPRLHSAVRPSPPRLHSAVRPSPPRLHSAVRPASEARDGFSPTHHLLLAGLRSDAERIRSIASHFDIEWDQVSRAAAAHGVLGSVSQALIRASVLPAEAQIQFGAAVVRVAANHAARLEDLRRVAEILGRAGISPLAVKGPMLVERSYRDPSSRYYGDVDVCVRPEEFRRALETLEAAGYRLEDRNWAFLTRDRRGQVHLRAPSGGVIELHWHIINGHRQRLTLNAGPFELWDATEMSHAAGVGCLVLEPAQEVAYLLLHAGLHGANRLIWFQDVARVLTTRDFDWDATIRTLKRWRYGAGGYCLLSLMSGWLSVDVPGHVLHSLRPGPVTRSALVAFTKRWDLGDVDGAHNVRQLFLATAGDTIGTRLGLINDFVIPAPGEHSGRLSSGPLEAFVRSIVGTTRKIWTRTRLPSGTWAGAEYRLSSSADSRESYLRQVELAASRTR